MRPVLFSIGPLNVYSYGLMIALGFIAALIILTHMAKKQGLDPDLVLNMILIALVTGLIGAKILYWLTVLPSFIADPGYYLSHPGDGLVIYGGLLADITFLILYLRRKGQNVWAWFDIIMPAVALGQGIGRIGCFLAGCCYGGATSGSFCVIFPEGSMAPAGVPLIPTQLLSVALDVIHFAVLMALLRRKKADGQIMSLYLIFYSVGRFILEFFRGDIERGSVGPLSTSQFISIFTLIAGIMLFVFFTRRGELRDPEAEAVNAEDEAEAEAANAEDEADAGAEAEAGAEAANAEDDQ